MKTFKLCAIALIAAMAFFSCSSGGDPSTDDGSLPGTITICDAFGNPAGAAFPAYTWDELFANYSGGIDVAYQWKRGTDNVGTNNSRYTPNQPGEYTVTVSAPGKTPKTSAPVTVIDEPGLNELSGVIKITVDDEPVTTAQTGDILTADYNGTETNVQYQWFKDENPLTAYASTAFTTCTPIEGGSYTVKVSLGSMYRPIVSDPVAVTGQALLTITFELNGASGENPTRIIAPGSAVDPLPSAPEYNGFTFAGWYTQDGQEVDADTTFSENTTVKARWIFEGGTPYVDEDEDTLVHPNPKMEKGQNFAGTISEEDGTITYTAGGFQYKWPTGDWDINDYAYCTVRFELVGYTNGTGSDPKGGSGVSLRLYNSHDSLYGGVDNEYPWLTNVTSSGIRIPLFGAKSSGGFSIRYGGKEGGYIEVRITSITFYKLPWRTVTFNLNGGSGTIPENGITVYDGYTIDTQRPGQFPAKPALTDYTFMGWQNPAGNIVTATTPITADWELTAQWTLTSELPAPEDTAEENGTLFAASGGSAAAKFAYDGKEWWVMAETPPGTPAAVAPFNGDAADTYTAALAEAVRTYTRIRYSLPSLSDIWQSFPKVTVTYDLVIVGGSDLSITVRNGVGAGGEPGPGNTTFAAGIDKTITFNTSALDTGNLAFVANNNGGGDALFLLRITKVELKLD